MLLSGSSPPPQRRRRRNVGILVLLLVQLLCKQRTVLVPVQNVQAAAAFHQHHRASDTALRKIKPATTTTTTPAITTTTRRFIRIIRADNRPTTTCSRGSPVVVWSRASDSLDDAAAAETAEEGVDWGAITKYGIALLTQMSLFFGFFTLLDTVAAATQVQIPFAANVALFYGCALKSRVFNPLANNRPSAETMEAEGKPSRVMPSWTPPGVVFPIVWLLVIGPLRAVSSAMIVDAVHSYANPTVLALMLHLSIGDVWNTINNVEQRYGVSVVGVACVWVSKAFAAYQYYQVDETAGALLALPLIWLTIAGSLIARTWMINPDPKTGRPEPFYPTLSDDNAKTEFVWFQPRQS